MKIPVWRLHNPLRWYCPGGSMAKANAMWQPACQPPSGGGCQLSAKNISVAWRGVAACLAISGNCGGRRISWPWQYGLRLLEEVAK